MARPGYESVVLITGFPTFGARQLLTQVVRDEPKTLVYAVVPNKASDEAIAHLETLTPAERARVEIFEGDAEHMDLGLSGAEFRRLASEVDRIHHLAQASGPPGERRAFERGNVNAAREVLELAGACDQLKLLVHHSTAFVCGDRTGVVFEDELERGQRFRNLYEETKARAEKLVRAASARLPIAVVRPTNIVGDSSNGEVDRLDGPYFMIMLILVSPAELAVPLPGGGATPMHVVPVDFVTRAAHVIGRRTDAAGKTFHLGDPHPLTARRAFELVAHAGGRRTPRGYLPANLTKALLLTPGLERFAKSPRTFLEQLVTPVRFDARNTDRALAGAGIVCPPFESYVDHMVAFVRERVRERREQRRAANSEVDDPLS